MDQWRCTVNNGDPRNWTLSPTLSPLAAVKDRLLVVEGVAQQSSYDAAQQATAHQGGAASLKCLECCQQGAIHVGQVNSTIAACIGPNGDDLCSIGS